MKKQRLNVAGIMILTALLTLQLVSFLGHTQPWMNMRLHILTFFSFAWPIYIIVGWTLVEKPENKEQWFGFVIFVGFAALSTTALFWPQWRTVAAGINIYGAVALLVKLARFSIVGPASYTSRVR